MRRLFEFQKKGVAFLLERPAELDGNPHRLLLDDVGLGKTIQTAAAIVEGKICDGLIICPKPIKETWKRQLIEWANLDPDEIHIVESSTERIPLDTPWIIINYELLIYDFIHEQLNRRWYELLVVDEIHRLKTDGSQRTRAVLGTRKENGLMWRCLNKWGLSATFMPNRPIEMWPVISTWAPQILGPYNTKAKFGQRFCRSYYDKRKREVNYKGAARMPELRQRLKPFVKRRMAEQVFKDMPPVVQHDVFFDIGSMECDLSNTPMSTLRVEVANQKAPFVAEYLRDRIQNEEEKFVVFCHSQVMIEKLQEALADLGAVKIYGKTSEKERKNALFAFTQGRGSYALIAQMQVLGTGFDGLQYVCNNLIFAEPDWVAGDWEQMIGRLRRIGQCKPVQVYKCIAEGTLDEPMDGSRLSKKRNLTIVMEPFNEEYKDKDMTIEASLERIAIALEKLAGNAPVPTATAASSTTEPAAKPPAKPEAKPTAKPNGSKPAAGKPNAKPVAKPTPVTTADDSGSALTLDQLRKGVSEVVAALGNDDNAKAAAREVINAHGAAKMDELDPSSYEAVLAGVKALLDTPAEDAGNSDDL